ncbi:hypothetical protein VCHA53O466_50082 [Vibrio chagasii]|nr:hypothetical protein VCHA53O466_50082 [Vibrio chagasii]
MIDTPNQLIMLRFVLCFSQKDLAEALGIEKSTILRFETSKTSIKRKHALAFEGLLYEQADLDGGKALAFFNSIDCDKAVEFLLKLSGDKSRNILPRWRLPECHDCLSKNVVIIKDYKAKCRAFGYECEDCGHRSELIESHNLARRYEILRKGSLNIYNRRWYSSNPS